MKRRSFIAAALSALAGSTALRGAASALPTPAAPVELARPTGFTPPTTPAEPAKAFFWGTKGRHPNLFAVSPANGCDAIYEKFGRAMAEKIDEEFFNLTALCKEHYSQQAIAHNSRIAGFPVRKFSH